MSDTDGGSSTGETLHLHLALAHERKVLAAMRALEHARSLLVDAANTPDSAMVLRDQTHAGDRLASIWHEVALRLDDAVRLVAEARAIKREAITSPET